MKQKKAQALATDVLSIRRDRQNNYGHITLCQIRNYGKEMNEIALTLAPHEVPLPYVNEVVVFIKAEYLLMLVNNGLIHKQFKEPVTGIWCGFIKDSVYEELQYSPLRMYTKKISSII